MRAPSPDVRPPGIYTEPAERRPTGLSLGRTGIPGFVGLARRGPTDVPVRVTTPAEFLAVFGELPEGGFLQPAVEGFFRNGGKEAWIVRVAHKAGRSAGEPASPAARTLQDRAGNSRIFVRALSEGTWGNEVTVTVRRRPPKAQTFLTLDALAGETAVTLRSTHGLRPGCLVRLYTETQETFRYVASVEGKTVSWRDDQPLQADLPASAPSYVETVEFDLVVTAPFGTETYPGLSLHPAAAESIERVIAERSRLVAVTVLRSPGDDGRLPAGDDLPADLDAAPLEGGADGLWGVTPDDFIGMSGGLGVRSGLAALEAVEAVDLLAIPDVQWMFQRNAGREGQPFSTLKDVEVVQDAMLSQAERLNDRFALLDTPFPQNAERTREYRLAFDSRHAALYFPWIAQERRKGRREIPPCGHVAGIIARCDAAMGLHKAPANEVVEDAEDLSLLLRDEDVGLLNAEGINCLVSQGVRGLRTWGARTVSSDAPFRYLNVRRQMNAIHKVLAQGLQWVVFENNVPSLWKSVDRTVTQFLMDLWKQGWFQGETPEDGFYVKCDDETNPPEERDAGRLTVEVGVAPVRPAEYLVLNVAQEMQGPASEAG